MSTLELQRITKAYDPDEPVLHDVDLAVADGEFLVIVGPSGCGKSTLLRIIAGLESVTAGGVFIDGQPVNDVPSCDRSIGMAFQDSLLYTRMTVAENIAFPMKLASTHVRLVDATVERIADLLDLHDVLDQHPRQLSGGQRQRAALGRAMARSPRLFLMDEPMSNLDAKLRTDLRSMLVRLQRSEGITTVYITHDQVEAMAMGDHVAVMRGGRIVQYGTPTEIYERPHNVFAATFMGSPAMNVVEAVITDADDSVRFGIGSGSLTVGADLLIDHPELRGRVGRRVGLGVRPEAFRHVRQSSDDGEGAWELRVTQVERLGPSQLFHAVTDARAVVDRGDEIVCEDGASIAVHVGPEVDPSLPLRVGVDAADVRLFDLATGEAFESRRATDELWRPPDAAVT